MSVHPSIGRPLRWVLVSGPDGPVAGADGDDVAVVEDLATGAAKADAVMLDMMKASYVAPGVCPRPHAVVVAARAEHRGSYPALIVVSPVYPREADQRPAGLAMAAAEGRAVGDAIVVARSAGLTLDTVLLEGTMLETVARNEGIEVRAALQAFLEAAREAAKATTPRS